MASSAAVCSLAVDGYDDGGHAQSAVNKPVWFSIICILVTDLSYFNLLHIIAS